jgi:predicted RNase H-like nuclease (RuvC/YqgF family)
MRSLNVGQLGTALLSGCAIAFIFIESKRLGNSQWSFIIGIVGFAAPYILNYCKDQIKAKSQQITDQIKQKDRTIDKLEQEIKDIRIVLDMRIDSLEALIPSLRNIVDSNREVVTATSNTLEQLRGEIYSTKGETQNAGKIADVALAIAQSAQGRINDILGSGTLIKIVEQVTKHEIQLVVLESNRKNADNSSN